MLKGNFSFHCYVRILEYSMLKGHSVPISRSSTETHDNVDVDMEENQQPEISSESK